MVIYEKYDESECKRIKRAIKIGTAARKRNIKAVKNSWTKHLNKLKRSKEAHC